MRAFFSEETRRKWRAAFGDKLDESALIKPLTEAERAFCRRAATLERNAPLIEPEHYWTIPRDYDVRPVVSTRNKGR